MENIDPQHKPSKLSSTEFQLSPNPHFSRARAVQEQGISVRRRSVLLRGLNNADAEGVMPKALCRSGSLEMWVKAGINAPDNIISFGGILFA